MAKWERRAIAEGIDPKKINSAKKKLAKQKPDYLQARANKRASPDYNPQDYQKFLKKDIRSHNRWPVFKRDAGKVGAAIGGGVVGGAKLAGKTAGAGWKGLKWTGNKIKPHAAAAGGFAAGVGASAGGAVMRTSGTLSWVFLAILLYVGDFFFRFNGFNIDLFIRTFSTALSFESMFRILLNAGVIAIMVAYAVFKKPDRRDFFSFFILVELIWLIITFGAASSPIAMLHIAFAIIIWLLLINKVIPDKAQANLLVAACVFVDFFLFSIIAKLSPNMPYFNRLIIPVWFFVALIYTRESKIKSFLVFFVIIFYVFNAFAVVNEYNQFYRAGMQDLSEREIQSAKEYAVDSFTNMKNFVVSFWRKKANETLGPYYTGEIDQNAEAYLGVYIEDLKTTESVIYGDQ